MPPLSYARNLHTEAKFDVGSQGDDNGGPSKEPTPPATPPPAAQLASRSTLLTPMGLDLVLLSHAASAASSEAAKAVSSADVQGLTQMYYLDEKAEERALEAMAAPLAGSAAGVVVGAGGGKNAGSVARDDAKRGLKEAELLAGAEVMAFGDPAYAHAEPQGMTQMFFLDEEEEAEVAAAMLKTAANPSFLRERLGVPGEVVQGLRQVGRCWICAGAEGMEASLVTRA